MDPETLRIATSLRVGARICVPHTCRCGCLVDDKGYHLLSCCFNEGRVPRHSAINDIICRALKSAGVPSVLEPICLDRGDGKRPDSLTIFPFKKSLCFCWDATCVNTFSDTNLLNSAVAAASAAEDAEKRKRLKYPALVQRFQFEPIVIETSGVFGPSSANIIREIGHRVRGATGEPRGISWLKQRLSIAVQRGNAVTIMSSIKHLTNIREV